MEKHFLKTFMLFPLLRGGRMKLEAYILQQSLKEVGKGILGLKQKNTLVE